MRIKFLCIIICLFVNALVFASATNHTITGVVISGEDNEPLIGASVYVHADDLKKAGVSQTSLGTITDIDGKFSISVPEKVTRIHCSYIGFEEQAIILQGNKKNYRIVLQPSAHALADVVVTGYQTLERRKLTAAIAKVELSDAMIGANKSIDQALTGQIAGVAVTTTSGAPGAPARIRIRGTASLNGTQDPLWVLDGMPLEGTDIPKLDDATDNDIVNMQQSSIAGLSPNDIESITILKDAAATAIYGARAANGVIVVTTKRGRTGKPIINFNTKLTYTPNLDTSRLNLLNSQEKVDLELQLLKNNQSIYPNKGGVATILNKYNLMNQYLQNGWEGLSPEAQNAINQLKTMQTDWNDILFRDAFTQEYNISISGGTEKTTYYNSLGYSKENGNVPGVSMTRFNLTSKTSYQINKILKIGVSIFANRRKNQNFVSDKYGYSNPVFYSRTANPYFYPYDAEHNYQYDYDILPGDEPDLKRGFNIFEERENTDNETIISSFNSIFDTELRFNDQWKLSSQVGIQWDQSSQEQYVGENTFNMRNIREDSSYDENQYIVPKGGMHTVNNATTSQITWKVQGEYKNTFNDIHDIQIMAGSEIRKNWYNTQFTAGYGYDPKTLTTKPLNIRNDKDAEKYKLHTKTYQENAFASFYTTGSYSFMSRYTIGGSVRMDGSDLFGVDKKYRYLPIYSISGMWRASNEPFIQRYKWIDNLAIRLSYGLQGNIDKTTSPFLVGSYDNVGLLPGYDKEQTIQIEIRKNWYNTQFTAGYGYDPKTLTTKPLNIRNDKDAEKYKLHTKTYQENAFASFYTTGSYSFMSRYTIGGSVRMDGSDLFGVDKKYRYLPIYSISGMWRASNEPFIQRYKWIDNLAIRLSYGLQGNIDKTTSPFLVGSYDNVGLLPGYDKEQTIQIEGAPNSKLRWEKTASYNLGLDFSVLNQAINLSVDYYYRKGTDLIGKKLLPLENGFETMTINWASMENKGVEINLQTRNITTKKFSWYTTFNFAYNQNKVLKINTPDSQETPSLEGYPVGAIFTLKTDGIDSETGRIRVKAKNGKSMFLEDLYKVAIDEWGIGIYTPQVSTLEEREFYSYIGTSDAPYTGGFMNTFNYKSWELNLNFSYNFGAYVKTTPSYSLTKFDASRNTNRDILDRWTPENKNGKFPAILTAASNPAEYSLLFDQPRIYNSLDIWVKKLNYIRLQNIRLAYQIPSKLLNRININGATVAVEARNLFVFGSSYKNYLDPESMGNLYATPIAKSVTFNLSLNF